jgi:hypothetical protein
VQDDHAWLIPRIRAALDAGVPPTAIILRDPERKEYNSWDLRIAAAYHIHEDLMRGSVPIYWDESDRVAFDVKTGVSKSRAAIDRREDADRAKNKDGKGLEGRYYYAVPRVIDGGALPTLEEWIAEKEAKKGLDRGPGGPR